MRSRSNSSNKDEKQAIVAKTFIDINKLFTANVLRSVITETELQINRKTFYKNDEAQKPKYIFENKYFQNL